jgi:hypothetical protein
MGVRKREDGSEKVRKKGMRKRERREKGDASEEERKIEIGTDRQMAE